MNNYKFLIICFLIFLNGYSQTALKGKIIAEISNHENINIINLSNKNATVSDALGYFDINAKPQDTLVFSAVNIVGIQVVLKQSDFNNKLYFIRLKTKINQLEDVTINNKINAVSLGIIPKGIKRYTPAERRLRAASNTEVTFNGGLMAGGSVGIDPIINAISGRTKKLKRELKIEINERNLIKLDNYYTTEYYIENLKIPENYINGFQIYALDDQRVVNALKSKNKTLVDFLLSQIAEKYLQIITPK